MKRLFLVALFLLVLPGVVWAQDSSVSNNKYGISLAQPNPEDLEHAADLVNSNGGDWGYVTLVMQENDRDRGKWQHIFETMRQLHLIPIIRLATQPQGPVWKRPSKDDAVAWVNFLNSLNWVVKQRYVILFNEPNHAAEWGGAVDPGGYADTALTFARTLKSGNEDFVIMVAGFDASAPAAPPAYHDEEVFIRALFRPETVNEWNSLLGGWSSHSYPNPAFAGAPSDSGKGTVKTYQWELELLKNLGVKELPVFITETGWDAHRVGQDQAAAFMRTAFVQTWFSDTRIKAVTPFLLSYYTAPFSQFSWILEGGKPQPVYTTVQELPKTNGRPELIERGAIRGELPAEIVTGSLYRFPMIIRNTGQGVWDEEDGYKIRVEGVDSRYYYTSDLSDVSPFEETTVYVYAQTVEEGIGTKQAQLALYQDDRKLKDLRDWSFEVLPLPSLKLNIKLFPPVATDSREYEVQIFDADEQVVFKKQNVSVTDYKALIPNVPNVVLGRRYRVVILRPYYLPRQTFVRFQKGMNEAKFPWMIPVDINTDGKLDAQDFIEIMRRQGTTRS